MRTIVSLLAGAVFLAVVPHTSPPVPNRQPVKLHPAVRAVLDEKMEAHAAEMTDLVMLVVLLERSDAAEAATRIASEPKIGRPLDMSDASAGIPDPFFGYQTELAARADQLADAARTGTDAEMATALGNLTATCVACHSRYLTPD